MMKVIFEKQIKDENGELVFVECPEKEATFKEISFPESRREMNQERPGKRIKL